MCIRGRAKTNLNQFATLKVKSVLASQPRPAVIEKSPFYELSQKHHVEIAYRPFIRVEGVSLKEFRACLLYTSRSSASNSWGCGP